MKIFNNAIISAAFILIAPLLNAQNKALVNTTNSNYAKLQSLDMGDVQWTTGFWGERYKVCKDSMVPHLWQTYTQDDICHAFENFKIAAGIDTGHFKGPSFHDGDFYKTLESVAGLYASTKDPKLDRMMDTAIAVIAKAQKADGYIYTKAIIDQQHTGKHEMFDDKLSFEAYNFGHLMTAACVHYRATGKRSLLDIAIKATDFLIDFYDKATPEQARNAICPSHYMGIIEMYRTTGEKKYLDLAKRLINIRGLSDGTDDNSDRVPFREMKAVNGHAVRANYLFAGVADIYAETGDTTLLHTLNLMWDDVVNHKLYITGGCGALYDGLSASGLTYKPDSMQRIQQAYGKDYQLPNETAHNETCANVGNLLWNWRMLQITGEAKYADLVELELYNGILSGISLDGNKFFYTNPLAVNADYPYDLRWSGGRSKYIQLSNCCPSNVIRTISEVGDYAYNISSKGLYVNLYGGNNLNTHLKDGSILQLNQSTDYPWNGDITINLQQVPAKAFSVFLRIPGWAQNATVLINNKPVAVKLISGKYAEINRNWKAGDKINLQLPMPVTLMEANPLVEETRNQVAVKRGPIVYCLESSDFAEGTKIFDITMPAAAQLKPVIKTIDGLHVADLEGMATIKQKETWTNALYKPMSSNLSPIKVTLIPYYAWANRGKSDMTVWMPVSK